MTMKEDLSRRSMEIRWPDGFAPEEADLFAHNQLLINAPAERIWQLLIEANNWPDWYPNAKGVRIQDGGQTLQTDSSFSWTTFGLSIDSRVSEYEPYSRLTWQGFEKGGPPQFCHAWHIIPQGADCLVVTDESAKGPLPKQFRQADESVLNRGHEMWLAVLRWKAESK